MAVNACFSVVFCFITKKIVILLQKKKKADYTCNVVQSARKYYLLFS